jgi:acetyltransferase
MSFFDSISDILPPSIHYLSPFFNAKSVAIIGASEKDNSIGKTLLNNLLKGNYKGKIFPVNPKRDFVFNIKCYPNIETIQEIPELAVIIVPAKSVATVVTECGKKGIKFVIIISAGFKELGPKGLELENEVLKQAILYGIRIIGPNCLGIINPHENLNLTFATGHPLKGNLAFISQSGAMCTAVLDWSLKKSIGFSLFVSVGSMADINFGDLIDYLGSDPNTKSILIYMETIGDARSFMSAAKEVALSKPIILIKPGKTNAAAKAAASHTGSLAGSDVVFDAAMHRAGVLRVETISDLFNMALVLSLQPKLKGGNLKIVSNAGGPAVIATDALIESGGELSEISDNLLQNLNQILSPSWSHSNPIDILGDASSETYGKAAKLVIEDPSTDALLAIFAPQDTALPLPTAKCLIEAVRESKKPVITSWMGGKSMDEAKKALQESKLPNFTFPDTAAKILATLGIHRLDIQQNLETPCDIQDKTLSKQQMLQAKHYLEEIHARDRIVLSEHESKNLLKIYGINVSETLIAVTRQEAVLRAKELNFPVVLKLHSKTITHKSDVGGVKLNLNNEEEVLQAFDAIENSVSQIVGKQHFEGVSIQKMIEKDGYELILGSSIDEQFGPTLLFGQGGVLVEVINDTAITLPPLNTTLAKNLIKKTKIYKALQGVRGRPPMDIWALEKLLVRFSEMIVEQKLIKECDLNPLIITPNGLIVLDARVVLHKDPSKAPKIALRPYPLEYVKQLELNGLEFELRPIKPEDEPLVIEFHKTLSDKNIQDRFNAYISLNDQVSHERLARICASDYERSIAIIALFDKKIVGICRLIKFHAIPNATFSILLNDQLLNKELGYNLLSYLIEIAKHEGIKKLFIDVSIDNHRILNICEKLYFKKDPHHFNKNIIHLSLVV